MRSKRSGKKQKKEPRPFFRAFNKTWYVQLGKRQMNLGRDKGLAFEKYHKIMGDRKEVEATADTTVANVLDDFLQWLKDWREHGTYQFYQAHLVSFWKHVGDRLKLLDLNAQHVTKWVDKKHKESSPNTIYGAIRSVQAAMNWAVKRGYLPKSPVKGIEKPQYEPRDIVISPEQYAEILSRASDQSERDFFTVMWETGCRVQEIRSVEVKHFNRAERCWSFPRAKSKGKRVPRTVYLTDAAFEICERLVEKHRSKPLAKKNTSGNEETWLPIFRNRKGEAWTKNAIRLRFRKLLKPKAKKCVFCTGQAVAFVRSPYLKDREKDGRKRRNICERCIKKRKLKPEMLGPIPLPIAGLEEGTCATSFRHSFATRALKNRVAGLTVSVLLGHRDTRMISRVYGHLESDPNFLHEELKRATAGGE